MHIHSPIALQSHLVDHAVMEAEKSQGLQSASLTALPLLRVLLSLVPFSPNWQCLCWYNSHFLLIRSLRTLLFIFKEIYIVLSGFGDSRFIALY